MRESVKGIREREKEKKGVENKGDLILGNFINLSG